MIFKLSVFLLLVNINQIKSSELEVVNDDDLLNLIKTEKYVVALFTKRDSEKSDLFENELVGVREDLVDALNAWVVKVPNSHLTKLYSPTNEPALVFFRHGVPLLYHGLPNYDLIFQTLTQNKEPNVKELTDVTFEHLTQAASGATTGDWLVMFYTDDCIDCQRFQARWEAVAAQLKLRMNVARVNRGTTGAATARRFDVFFVPAFILFRQGKMYRYHLQKYDIDSFVSFAQNWYKNVKADQVPLPKTPFDDLVALIVTYLRENQWLLYVGLATFVTGLIIAFMMGYKNSKMTKVKSKPKKKEK